MTGKPESTLTHLYGIAGLLPGAVSIFYLVQIDASWKEYALVGSGWLAALFYGIMLWKCYAHARTDAEKIGRLTAELESEKQISERDRRLLSSELEQSKSISAFLVSLQMGRHATPRTISTAEENTPPEHQE